MKLDLNKKELIIVAILILMESFLQFDEHNINSLYFMICRNPYFNGILSAISLSNTKMLQSILSRNPYFNGILSAI
mgnify:CR=1 FL=1